MTIPAITFIIGFAIGLFIRRRELVALRDQLVDALAKEWRWNKTRKLHRIEVDKLSDANKVLHKRNRDQAKVIQANAMAMDQRLRRPVKKATDWDKEAKELWGKK